MTSTWNVFGWSGVGAGGEVGGGCSKVEIVVEGSLAA